MNTQTTYLASKPHYEILDGLRGVAAVMVVAFHLLEAHSGGNHLTQIINHGYLAVDYDVQSWIFSRRFFLYPFRFRYWLCL